MDDALAWLWHRGAAPATSASEMASAECAAGVFEGLLQEVAPALWAPRDLLTTPAARIASVAPLLPRHATLVRASAAWVHSGGLPPSRVSIALARGGGTPRPPLVIHVQQLPAADVLQLAGSAVTTARRTACDLLRFATWEVIELRVGQLLHAGLQPAEISAQLAGLSRAPGTARAARLLAALANPPLPVGAC